MSEGVRDRILDAARQEFVEKGMDGARMSEIAGKADVNKAMLHYYFDSKKKLYESVVKRIIEDAVLIPVQLSPHKPFRDNLRKFIDIHMNFVRENREIFSFIFWDFRSGDDIDRDALSEILRKKTEEPRRVIFSLIEKAISEGEIRDVDPENLIISILSLNVFVFIGEPFIKNFTNLSEEEFAEKVEERKEENFRLIWNHIKKQQSDGG